jgi:V-type H+-transporting ATPase subunit F
MTTLRFATASKTLQEIPDRPIAQSFISYLRFYPILAKNKKIANRIRPVVAAFKRPHPAVLEIPSKEHPYDPSKDAILRRVKNMLGSQD